MATGKNRRKKSKNAAAEESFTTEICLWIILAVSILLFISNFGIGGAVGNAVSRFFFGIFGLIAYVFPIILLVGTFFAVSNKGDKIATVKIVSSIIFVVFLCLFISLICEGTDVVLPLTAYISSYESKTGGGIIGGFFAWILCPNFGLAGSYVIDVAGLIISLVLMTGKSALKGVESGGKKVYETARNGNERYKEIAEQKSVERQARREEEKKRRLDKKMRGVSMDTKIAADQAVNEGSTEHVFSDEMSELYPISGDFAEDEPVSLEVASKNKVTISSTQDMFDDMVSAEPSFDESAFTDAENYGHEEDAADLSQKTEPPADTEAASKVPSSPVEPAKPYVFPPLNLLGKPAKKGGDSRQHLQETAIKLQQTLKNFGVNVTVTNISCGPAVTRYEIMPEMGVKVSRIVNLADDIKLNLAASDIRIEAPIPGKSAIGIEVPNKENVTVSFRELIESDEFKNHQSNIAFAVGKDISGKVTVADIAKMPHLLIAGATGSGKSVCINTIIMSIIYKADPSNVKMIMIDPKVVELSVYNGIPHLMIPVVTDPKKAAGALQWAVTEMTDRYNKFAAEGVRDLKGYNEKIDETAGADENDKRVRLPQIVIIVDELADLMMVASSEVEEAICRLAQLARACGIHLIIATQRPSVNVITGLIKANMPSRIAFAVTSGIDSRTILDMNGAEKLLGKGDMLFNPQGVPKPIRVQGAFISDREVSDVVKFLKDKNSDVTYSEEVVSRMNAIESSNVTVAIDGADKTGDGRDPYFKEAAKLLIDKEKASIGMLQRYFKVGFNRAARIMDQLEEAGVVGPEEGTKPRRVLMSAEEFDALTEE